MKKQLFLIIASVLLSIGNSSAQQQCRMDSIYSYTWYSSTSQFYLKQKYYYTYNASGQVLQMTDCKKDNSSDTSLWSSKYKYSYTYDAVTGNTLTLLIQQEGSGGMWNNLFLDSFNYDTNGKLVAEIYHSYNLGNQNWSSLINRKWTYAYNTVGNLSFKLFQLLNGLNNTLMNMSQWFYTYDTNRIIQLRQNWSDIDNAWHNVQTDTLNLNAAGQQTSSVTYAWNITPPPNYVSNTICGYDTTKAVNGYTIEALTQSSNNNGTTFVNSSKTISFYSCTIDTTGIAEHQPQNIEIKVYPNPANTEIYFEVPNQNNFDVEIYNTLGQMVLQKNNCTSDGALNISTLKPNVYYLKVKGNKGNYYGKILRE